MSDRERDQPPPEIPEVRIVPYRPGDIVVIRTPNPPTTPEARDSVIKMTRDLLRDDEARIVFLGLDSEITIIRPEPGCDREKERRMSEICKTFDLDKFREFGFPQEANRGFFHPLGLALAHVTDEDGRQHLQVLDARDDPEGWIYAWDRFSPEEVADSLAKAERVAADREARRPPREAALGNWRQPLPKTNA